MWCNSIRLFALLATVVVLAGCQRGETLGKLSGRVTLDGAPLSQGLVIFSNQGLGVHVVAPIDHNGHFEVQMAKGFGLPLGDYQVAVNPPALEPPLPGAPPPMQVPTVKIPQKYLQPDSSGLATTISAGENTFDIAMQTD